MGAPNQEREQLITMKTVAILAIAVLIAVSATESDSATEVFAKEFEEFAAEETEFAQQKEAGEGLVQLVENLKSVSTPEHAAHVAEISKHASLLRVGDNKAKAYKHNYTAAKRALKAAVSALKRDLTAGHNHDSRALRQAKSFGAGVVNSAHSNGKSTVRKYRDRACPTKRAEEKANSKKTAAKNAMHALTRGKICSGGLRTTWGDMDVDKNRPKFGAELRNKWDKTRGSYIKAQQKYNAAVQAHKNALYKHNRAMSAFRTALGIEARNANNTCRNSHKEYQRLCRDVQNNVRTRKEVYKAGQAITCYVDNMTSNARAKACADRRLNTSLFNIACGSLPRCSSISSNENSFGPRGWSPTSRNCRGAKPSPPSRPSTGGVITTGKTKYGKACNSTAHKICQGYNIKCYRTSLHQCKIDCTKNRSCHMAEHQKRSTMCCLSKIATKAKCPGSWSHAGGWVGYNICH